ncbi:MAG: RtcB family protein [Minisyncoccales bacterium]|jgi:tRNA-splicing ligase RtcB
MFSKPSKIGDFLWEIPQSGKMRVPARIYGTEKIIKETEEEAIRQIINVTYLPGIVNYAIAMPDIHSGYGPPIGGVGATLIPDGVISPGFVGYDQNCGVRLLRSDLSAQEIKDRMDKISTAIQSNVPSGLGKGRTEKMSLNEIDLVLKEGVSYLVGKGYGVAEDIIYCEESGRMDNADPKFVSDRAKERGRGQLGTLGSGNHFCEIQKVVEVFDKETAEVFGIENDQVVIMIHTGSRGLGHQNCTDYLKIISNAMDQYGIKVPDRELACVPFNSTEGSNFFAALSAACNFAWANRQMITHYVRLSWEKVFGEAHPLDLVYDVAHNIAKVEEHEIDGVKKKLLVHRKGATRAFPPESLEIPERHRKTGQVVFIPGSMGDSSYILSGVVTSNESWHTVCHGAGRRMSRKAALRKIDGRNLIKELNKKGIIVKSHSLRGIAEEAPSAYKDIDEVIGSVVGAKLAKKVAKLKPLAVIKGE